MEDATELNAVPPLKTTRLGGTEGVEGVEGMETCVGRGVESAREGKSGEVDVECDVPDDDRGSEVMCNESRKRTLLSSREYDKNELLILK